MSESLGRNWVLPSERGNRMSKRKLMKIAQAITGALMALIGGRSFQWILGLIVKGVETGNIYMILGGGVLAYFFLAITAIVCIAGILVMIDALDDIFS